MLKIKDNVDLKELEKFGFKHKKETKAVYEHYAYLIEDEDDLYPRLACCVWSGDRQIGIFTQEGNDILFDLIQAGLVEKVVEE